MFEGFLAWFWSLWDLVLLKALRLICLSLFLRFEDHYTEPSGPEDAEWNDLVFILPQKLFYSRKNVEYAESDTFDRFLIDMSILNLMEGGIMGNKWLEE